MTYLKTSISLKLEEKEYLDLWGVSPRDAVKATINRLKNGVNDVENKEKLERLSEKLEEYSKFIEKKGLYNEFIQFSEQ